jgi:hypothetical protein
MEITFDLKTWAGIAGVAGVVAVFIMLFMFVVRWDSRRKQGLRDFAQRERLSYVEEEVDRTGDDWPASQIGKRFQYLQPFKKEDDLIVTSLISGVYRSHEMMAFDLRIQKRKSTDSDGVVLLMLEKEFPTLFVWDKEMISEVSEEARQHEIPMADPVFMAKLSVFSNDEAFAAAFCHPRMREFLLKQECVTLQLQGESLSTSAMAVWDAEELRTQLDFLIEVRTLMPNSMFVT